MRSTLWPDLFAALTAGCSTVQGTVAWGYLAFNRMDARQMVMSDGYRARYFVHAYGRQKSPDTLLFFVTGSGSDTAQLSCRFTLNDVRDDVRVFALDKRHVSSWSTGRGAPSAQYWAHHYPSAWTRDQKEFLTHILEREDLRGRNVVLLGASAGGAIAAELAHALPQVTHLAILGEGGMKGLDSFRLWGQRHYADFDALYAHVKADPSTARMTAGYSAKVYAGCDHAIDDCAGTASHEEYLRDLVGWIHANPPAGRLSDAGAGH